MKKIINLSRKIPGFSFVYDRLEGHYILSKFKKMSSQEVFAFIHRSNAWRSQDSVSGPGSELHQTRLIVKQLPDLLRRHSIRSLLDAPCGDYNWMRKVDLGETQYTGGDVVLDLIQQHKVFEKPGVTFRHLDLLEDQLPPVDLIFCRDCFVHFSFHDIFRALLQIVSSEATYLLTTTYPEHKQNIDIITGLWRTLNFTKAPFYFPPPLEMIIEGCTEQKGKLADKALGLWKIDEIRNSPGVKNLFKTNTQIK